MSTEVYCDDSNPKFKISVGIGGPNVVKYTGLFKLFKKQEGYKENGTGPFHLKVEYRYKWWLGFGVSVNYTKFNITYIMPNGAFDPKYGPVPNEVKIRYKNTSVNLRANLYFLNPEKRETRSEPYFGMGLGYRFGKIKVSSQYEEFTPTITFGNIFKLGFEATFGYRYNFNKHIAVYSELGVSKSILQAGITGSF